MATKTRNRKLAAVEGSRHTYASRLLSNGVDSSVASKFLGHTDSNTTYSKNIHVLNDQLDIQMKTFVRICLQNVMGIPIKLTHIVPIKN